MNETIEVVKTYTYLGIEIHNCGSFKEALNCLYDKAMKVYFRICKDLYDAKVWLQIKVLTA